jgi:hypothetical protein
LERIVGKHEFEAQWSNLNTKIVNVFDQLKWLVKEYVYDIRRRNRLEQVVMLLDRKGARYVRYTWNGMASGVHAVVID